MADIAPVSTVHVGGTRRTTAPIAEKTCTVASAPGASVASCRSSSDRPITLVTSAPWKAVARLVCSERPITDTRRTRSPGLASLLKDRMPDMPDTCRPTTTAIQMPSVASDDSGRSGRRRRLGRGGVPGSPGGSGVCHRGRLAPLNATMRPNAMMKIGHDSSSDAHPVSPSSSQTAAVRNNRPCLGSPGFVWRNLASPMPPRMSGHSVHCSRH